MSHCRTALLCLVTVGWQWPCATGSTFLRNQQQLATSIPKVSRGPAAQAKQSHKKNVLHSSAQHIKSPRNHKVGQQLASMPEVLLQRKAVRSLRRRRADPRNVEDVELIMGVPKIVWVLLADAVAMLAWAGCIGLALMCSRNTAKNKEIDREQLEQTLYRNAQYMDHLPPPPSNGYMPSSGSGRPPTFTRL